VVVNKCGGGNWSTRRKTPPCRKSLTNFDGEDLPVMDNRIHIENSGNIANAKLIIFSLMFDDQGDYQCYANYTDSFNSNKNNI
jgi:hypothetical protein